MKCCICHSEKSIWSREYVILVIPWPKNYNCKLNLLPQRLSLTLYSRHYNNVRQMRVHFFFLYHNIKESCPISLPIYQPWFKGSKAGVLNPWPMGQICSTELMSSDLQCPIGSRNLTARKQWQLVPGHFCTVGSDPAGPVPHAHRPDPACTLTCHHSSSPQNQKVGHHYCTQYTKSSRSVGRWTRFSVYSDQIFQETYWGM